MKKKSVATVAGGIVALSAIFATPFSTFASAAVQNNPGTSVSNGNDATPTTTPIKHVVVIFGENVSFDHYFGTYPNALNPAGEPAFHAAPNTPTDINNYITHPELLTSNLNGVNPQRLDRTQAITADMDHGYSSEQKAFDGGKMDNFVNATGHGNNIVMDYYDGNTVTGLWNYAQHFAMSDNSYGTTFGPSTPGALNLISGQTHGATVYSANVTKNGTVTTNSSVQNGTVIGDPNPYYDSASGGSTVAMSGKNVGNLLNAKDVTWGWFEGGFNNPTAQHPNANGTLITDYSPHHAPFQYYQSTSNPNHLPPSSVSMIGHQGDQANHNYDISDFWAAVDAHNMPAVSFLKAPASEDAHPGNSGPLDEQKFVVNTINQLEKTPEWENTAVIISYDDSDGWYDHQMASATPMNGSQTALDYLFGQDKNGIGNAGALNPLLGGYQDRAGYGPRLPLMVISPYAKQNFVDHTLTDQSSILKFIEDNWNLGRIGDGSYDAVAGSLDNMFDFSHGPRAQKLFLDPITGEQTTADVQSGDSSDNGQ